MDYTQRRFSESEEITPDNHELIISKRLFKKRILTTRYIHLFENRSWFSDANC